MKLKIKIKLKLNIFLIFLKDNISFRFSKLIKYYLSKSINLLVHGSSVVDSKPGDPGSCRF